MFSVMFEVHPQAGQSDAYLGYARVLKPELEKVDGFVDNVRYRSLTREGWILSLSGWRDEKAVVRWRTQAHHHAVQNKGRTEVFLDYHLRVGEVIRDTRPSTGGGLREQRLDETDVGEATTVTLIDARHPSGQVPHADPGEVARWLGLVPAAAGLVVWDVFDAVLTPGDAILLLSWRNQTYAEVFERAVSLPNEARLRRVRVIRDYGMFDRREAPQYYPDVPGGRSVHS
jgi:heme-degrading monooxygenase HmoA